jgi:hypothetical protein
MRGIALPFENERNNGNYLLYPLRNYRCSIRAVVRRDRYCSRQESLICLFINSTLEFDVGNKNFTELCANFNETEFEKAQNDILINEINKNLEDNEVAEETEESGPISDAQVQESTTRSTTTSSTTTALSIGEKQLDIATTTSASETISSTSLTTTSSAEEENMPVDNRLLYLYCQLEGKILSLLGNIANFRIHA